VVRDERHKHAHIVARKVGIDDVASGSCLGKKLAHNFPSLATRLFATSEVQKYALDGEVIKFASPLRLGEIGQGFRWGLLRSSLAVTRHRLKDMRFFLSSRADEYESSLGHYCEVKVEFPDESGAFVFYAPARSVK
jgi:hypothetical protein